MKFEILNGGTRSGAKAWFSVVAQSDEGPAQVRIYGQIGKDYYSQDGVDAKEFAEALDKLSPTRDRALEIRMHTPGGNVFEGLNIYVNLTANWKGRVDTFNEGLCASIGSLILLAAKNGGKVHAAKASQTMIHNPSTFAAGEVKDMKQAIDALEACKKSILIAYQDKTGQPKETLSALMDKTTWWTGEEAAANRFVDVLTESTPLKNEFNLSNFLHVPEVLRNLQNAAATGGQQNTLMNRQQIIARLKKLGQTVDDKSTDEQLLAQLDAAIDARAALPAPAPAQTPTDAAAVAILQAQVANISAAHTRERNDRITREVDACVLDRRITVSQRDSWIKRAIADETILADLRAMPENRPAEGITVDCVSEAISDLANHAGMLAGRTTRAPRNAMALATFLRKNEARFIQVWNEGTNTIDTTLKMDVILDIGLKAFAYVLTPLSNFSTMFTNAPVKGNDTVQVPFIDLVSTSPTDWVAGTGYVAGDTTNDNRPVVIDKRKYLGIQFTSQELRRQPFLMMKEQMEQLTAALAYAIWANVLSVVTNANYGLPARDANDLAGAPYSGKWPKAPGAFDSDAVADLQQLADDTKWPATGRVLMVNSTYDNALKKDSSLKLALNIGGTEVMRQGMIPDVYGFNYYKNSFLPANGENLCGFIAQKPAILIATAPIAPDEEVIRSGTRYSVAVDPDTGIALEYRSFGNNVLDISKHFVECNYGFAKGNASALKRLTSA